MNYIARIHDRGLSKHHHPQTKSSRAWWCTSIIPKLEGGREDLKSQNPTEIYLKTQPKKKNSSGLPTPVKSTSSEAENNQPLSLLPTTCPDNPLHIYHAPTVTQLVQATNPVVTRTKTGAPGKRRNTEQLQDHVYGMGKSCYHSYQLKRKGCNLSVDFRGQGEHWEVP